MVREEVWWGPCLHMNVSFARFSCFSLFFHGFFKELDFKELDFKELDFKELDIKELDIH